MLTGCHVSPAHPSTSPSQSSLTSKPVVTQPEDTNSTAEKPAVELEDKELTPTITSPPEVNSSPTSISIPTGIKTPVAFQFPAWMCEPTLPVLVVNMNSYKADIRLINPQSGDIYKVPIPGIAGYFWMADGMNFGLIMREENVVWITDICTGEVDIYPLGDQATELISDREYVWNFGEQSGEPGNSDFPVFKNHYEHAISISRTYAIDKADFDDDRISIKNLTNDQQQVIEAPNGHPYLIDWAWSPKEDKLAILWSDIPTGHSLFVGNNLQLFDPIHNTTRILAEDYLTQFEWSPDGERMVYKQGNVSSHGGACILEIEPLKESCFTSNNLLNDNFFIYQFHWLQDCQSLSYSYYRSTYDSQVQEDRIESGICIVDFSRGSHFCPSEKFPEISQSTIRIYLSSPDEKYFLIEYDLGSCPVCDFTDRPGFGILSLDGRIFHSIFNNDPYSIDIHQSMIWRPVNNLRE